MNPRQSGLPPRENDVWPTFNQLRHRPELMDQMILRLGVDLPSAIGVVKGEAFVQARSTCRNCPNESACWVWLDEAGTRPIPPDFCPNVCFFRQCGLLGSYGLWRERRLPDRLVGTDRTRKFANFADAVESTIELSRRSHAAEPATQA